MQWSLTFVLVGIFGLAAPTARAAELEVGVGLGGGLDLGDRASTAGDVRTTSFGGGSLAVPIGLRFGGARLRFEPRFDMGAGADRVSWAYVASGEPVRQYADGDWGGAPTAHGAMLAVAALQIGADFDFPIEGNFKPYFGASAGPAMAWTFHTWRDESAVGELLKIRGEEGLYGANKSDATTSQLSFQSELHLGGRVGPTDGMAVWFETGYSTAFIDARPLSKTPEGLDARREAFGWNPVRLAVGVSLPL